MLQWMRLVVMGLVLGWEHTAGTEESFTYIRPFSVGFWSPHSYTVEESENLLPLCHSRVKHERTLGMSLNTTQCCDFVSVLVWFMFQEIWHVYAKQIAKLISESSNKPVLLGIALKKHSPQILLQILHLLQANRVW